MFRRMSLLFMVLALIIFAGLPALAQDEFVFGVVLVGPNDDRGWSTSHHEAGLYVEANVPGARMLEFESLNPADSPETTLRMWLSSWSTKARRSFHSRQLETDRIVRRFPHVVLNFTGSNAIQAVSCHGDHAFMHELPELPSANVGNFNTYMELPRMIAGCAAALASESGHIGYLGALINPETRRLVASSYLGARYCADNYRDDISADDITFEVKWIGFWFHIPGVTLDPVEVAQQMLDGGADVIISAVDTERADFGSRALYG